MVWGLPRCVWAMESTAPAQGNQCLAFKILAEFVFYAGIICGIVGILLNENYVGSVGLSDYGVFKGLLSHSTMLLGSIYILVGGFIKIRVFNVISVACGLVIFFIDGVIMNFIYDFFRDEQANSMYLQEAPFESMPWLNTGFIGIAGVLITFIVSAIYEQIALKKEERWYFKIKEYVNSKRKGEKV